ncbi:MAG: hypothetical protein ACPKPY_05535 [Nitrososphaeraceae archaeon]
MSDNNKSNSKSDIGSNSNNVNITSDYNKDNNFTNNNINNQINEEKKSPQKKEIEYILEAASASKQITSYLAKKDNFWIQFDDGTKKEFERKPLSTKQNKEIEKLRNIYTNFSYYEQDGHVIFNGKEYRDNIDVLYNGLYKLIAKYSLSIHSDEEFDSAIWENDANLIKEDIWGLKSVLEGVLLRNIGGLAYFRQPSKNL